MVSQNLSDRNYVIIYICRDKEKLKRKKERLYNRVGIERVKIMKVKV